MSCEPSLSCRSRAMRLRSALQPGTGTRVAGGASAQRGQLRQQQRATPGWRPPVLRHTRPAGTLVRVSKAPPSRGHRAHQTICTSHSPEQTVANKGGTGHQHGKLCLKNKLPHEGTTACAQCAPGICGRCCAGDCIDRHAADEQARANFSAGGRWATMRRISLAGRACLHRRPHGAWTAAHWRGQTASSRCAVMGVMEAPPLATACSTVCA